MKPIFVCSLLLFSLFLIEACTYDKGEVPKPIKTVSYTTDIVPIMQTYCYGENGQSCHVTATNMGAPGDFTSYAGLKEKVDNNSISSRVFNLKDMPPTYSNGPTALSAEHLETFRTWVNDGAPNN
ncbi:MAG: hypothetical protein WBM13_06460 [Bacteroidia bacterium]